MTANVPVIVPSDRRFIIEPVCFKNSYIMIPNFEKYGSIIKGYVYR